MTSYNPKPGDIAMDLLRCFKISVDYSFDDTNFAAFFAHASKDLDKIGKDIDKVTFKNVQKCLHRSSDGKINIDKRREDLLTASDMLLHA